MPPARRHLWQNRYYSTVLDERHLLAAMCYVETNPVRAGMVKDVAAYLWSSAGAHLTGRDPSGLLDLACWQSRFTRQEWRAQLTQERDPAVLLEIRNATATGRPIAGDRFIAELEHRLGRRLTRKPAGRPKKGSDRKSEKA